MSLAVRWSDLELGEHTLVGHAEGGAIHGYECTRCGRFHRSPETFKIYDCHDRHP